MGMTDDVLRHAFEPFFTTKDRSQRSGLGLATAYGIVTQASGKMTVESTPGVGSTFRILLPTVAGEPTPPSSTLPEPHQRLEGTETVLLVEDEADVRAVASAVLRNHGYRVLEAADATHARALLESAAEPVDALVTDVVMPGPSGIDLAKWAMGAFPSVHVVLMTGYSGSPDVTSAVGEQTEPWVVLAKPFTPAQLLARVREALSGGGHLSSAPPPSL
jgi:CheY-like chemotaxis protein